MELITYNHLKNQKQKQNINFLDIIKNSKDESLIQAKFPKPRGVTVDLEVIKMKGKSELLVLMTDNKVLRQREKTKAQNEVQMIYFASVAHD